MSSLMSSLGIDKLTHDQQLQLVSEILNNLESQPVADVTPAQNAELDRRLAAIDGGSVKFDRWEDVEQRILASLQR